MHNWCDVQGIATQGGAPSAALTQVQVGLLDAFEKDLQCLDDDHVAANTIRPLHPGSVDSARTTSTEVTEQDHPLPGQADDFKHADPKRNTRSLDFQSTKATKTVAVSNVWAECSVVSEFQLDPEFDYDTITTTDRLATINP